MYTFSFGSSYAIDEVLQICGIIDIAMQMNHYSVILTTFRHVKDCTCSVEVN